MKKKGVFISHAGPEQRIAQALKALLENAFLGLIDVFVSSDPQSLPAGKKWLDTITDALKSCAVEIVIISPSSVGRPWINFEAGAGYIRDIPVIPLCHSGITESNLPPPLRFLQAVIATNADSLGNLLPVIASAIGGNVPALDFTEFVELVKAFEEESKSIAAFSQSVPIAADGGLRQHEMAALAELLELSDGPETEVAFYQLRNAMEKAGFNNKATHLGVAVLQRQGLVTVERRDDNWNDGGQQVVVLTSAGLEWLIGNQGNLEFAATINKSRRQTASDSFYESSGGISDDDVPF